MLSARCSTRSHLKITVLFAAALLSACGGAASIADVDQFHSGAADELTKPLESGVPRRTYGDIGQLRSYTFAINSTATVLTVDLTGNGDVTLLVKDPTAHTVCTHAKSGMVYSCRIARSSLTGTWTIDITGRTSFSGSLVATAFDAVDAGEVDAGSIDAGEVDAGTVDAGTVDAGVFDGGFEPDAGHGTGTTGAQVSIHTSMGFPGAASVGDLNHWLLVKPQYVVSFNSATKTPNWVSWELGLNWLGPATRSPSFHPDADLPNTVPQAANSDFDGTPYARGHMCPSSDRTVDATDNQATFVFTNVVPQLPNLNNGPWKGLENEERQLVKNGKTLYITSGPLGGTTRLGSGVLVPTATWKVIVVLDAPGTAANVTAQTRVISVIMQNDPATTATWSTYRTTVRDIEAQTGLDLLSDVASSVQDVVETRVDTGPAQGG